ncbi:uncharacterized protein LOC131145711 [Malania oleifera]|uniref:uncharacterized protein LOC131145711 n=1 Tax=Malania oleifera TaxID=397392 RepID=UPI0025AE3EB4|nr:uncharacterized protein LOC131145711 [Malania oleifera]
MTEMINVSMNEDEWKKRKNNGILYEALIKEEKQTVIQLCKQFPEGALHILTVHKDTVLHMAAYAQLGDLTKKLLDDVPDVHLDKMTRQNHIGNTVLHEAATSSDVALAEAVLQIAPGLLGMINHDGETALFRAVRYGKTKVFRFLSEKISTYDPDSQQAFLQNKDKTTILHAAVQVKRFGEFHLL